MLFIIFMTMYFCSANIGVMTAFTADMDHVDDFVKNIMRCKNIPGIGLAVVKEGISYAKGYGQADMEQHINASESTIFCLGSVTKSMTAMLLARLMSNKEYRFQWKSKIKDIMGDEYKFLDKCMTESVTLTDILSHRTGLATANLLLQAGVPASVTREKIMKNLHYLPKHFEFRDTLYYNNLVYVMSGHVAEKLTNQSWENLMKEQLFDPLNMTSSVFIDDVVFPTLAVPYVSDYYGTLQKSDKRLYNLHPYGPSGSVCSTPTDMVKWLKLIVSEGKAEDGNKLVNSHKIRQLFQPKISLLDILMRHFSLSSTFPVSFHTYGYGFGWFISYYRGHRLMHHSGSLYGYSCKIAYLPEKKSAFVFFTNGPGEIHFGESMDPIFFYLLDTVLGYTPWLNKTTSCAYPAYPEYWNKKKYKRSMVSKTSNERSTDIDIYCGDYHHPLYGTVNVKKINRSLFLSYGTNMKGNLRPIANSFILDLQEPLRSIFRSAVVSFDNLYTNKFRNVALSAHSEKYVFTRHEDSVNLCTIPHVHSGYFIIVMIFTKLTI